MGISGAHAPYVHERYCDCPSCTAWFARQDESKMSGAGPRDDQKREPSGQIENENSKPNLFVDGA